MTIAVTAASGKLGRQIIHALSRTTPQQTIVGLARSLANATDFEGIRNGALDVPSDDENAAGRPHRSWAEVFACP